MADHVGRDDVEQQDARCAAPATLAHRHRDRGKCPATAQLLELEAEREVRVGGPGEHHVRRYRAATRIVPSGGDDGLPEHLAALDDRPSMVADGDARIGTRTVGPHVEHVEQIVGVTPYRESLSA